MNFFLILSVFLALVYAASSDGDAFEIVFYEKPKFKKQNGIISGSVAPGGGAGTKRGNITIASFRTQPWLQVTLFEGVYWSGKSRVSVGSQKDIRPAFHVGSVKWKSLN